MKKLLTMMVSCASALFAMADDTLSTAKVEFTNYGGVQPNGAAVDLDITKDDAGGEGAKYWYSASALANGGIAEAVVTNNGANAYLMLDTSDVLERTIKPWTQGETLNFVPQAIGTTGIYFDSMVQFTATEDNVTPSEGDKLVVWLKAVETEMNGEEVVTPGYTNLMITAGNGEDAYNKAIRADFVASVASGVSIEPISIKPNSWHQLTIKAFVDDEGATFFNVYIDKKLVTGVLNETQVTDFESLVSKAEEELNPTTITSVGFKGTGAVDDLLFTNENPLGQDVTINVVDVDEYCAKIVYGEQTFTDFAQLKINVPVGTTEVSLKCYLDPLAMLVDGTKNENDVDGNNVAWTWTGSITDNTITLTINEVQTEPEPAKPFSITIAGEITAYATLAEAIANANGATITLTEHATLTGTLSIGEGVTAVIDLAGKTLTAGTVDNYSVVVKGDLTITDSIGDGEMILPGIYGIGVNGDNAKLVLEKADFIGEDADYLVGLWSGSVTVNSGTFVADYNIINVFGDGKAVVNDGTFTTQGDNDLENYDPNCVFLSDNDDAITVNGGMFSTTFKSAFCKKGFKLTEENGVWILVDETEEPEPVLPEVTPEYDENGDPVVTTEKYSEDAKTCLTTYFPKASGEGPAPALAVVINGVELFGDKAVAAINDVADKFTGNPFDETGTINLVFKVDDVMKALEGAAGGYTLTVGEAGLKSTYEVAPKFIDIKTGNEIQEPGEGATAKFFKLVIRAKSVQ